MTNFHIALPIALYMVKVLDDNQQTLHSYLFQLLHTFGIVAPKRLLISILIQPIIGVGYQNHYQLKNNKNLTLTHFLNNFVSI